MDEKIKSRLKKLLNLANRGLGGEKKNAKTKLNLLLEKYNLSIDDLENWKKRYEYKARYRTKHERSLIVRIYENIRPEINTYIDFKKKRFCVLELSKSEQIEFRLTYEIYRKALRKELERTFKGFLVSQNLFLKAERSQTLSEDDMEDFMKTKKRSMDIDEINIRKQIGE